MLENTANTKKIGLGLLLASLAWLTAPIANAQSDTAILASVRACQSVTGLSERLACYDRVLQPGTDSVGTVGATRAAPQTPPTPPTPIARTTETIDRGNARVSREQEL